MVEGQAPQSAGCTVPTVAYPAPKSWEMIDVSSMYLEKNITNQDNKPDKITIVNRQ
jgi:hypothetical protein